eukprot:scaffold47212_cov174-Isochrysis_galbana.AAC.1
MAHLGLFVAPLVLAAALAGSFATGAWAAARSAVAGTGSSSSGARAAATSPVDCVVGSAAGAAEAVMLVLIPESR